jgi:hypothetical protein
MTTLADKLLKSIRGKSRGSVFTTKHFCILEPGPQWIKPSRGCNARGTFDGWEEGSTTIQKLILAWDNCHLTPTQSPKHWLAVTAVESR